MKAIQIKNVSKKFKDVDALKNINITLEHGKIYGLLGRNGAGKSTLLNVITNRLLPDEGTVLIDDMVAQECDEALHNIFLMSEVNMYPKSFKVKDVFYYTKQFYHNFDMEYANELCELFHLNSKKRITQLSTGYASIYKIITALSIDVPYVFFDEPVLGLDANHRDLFYKLMLERYASLGNTYVISTHLIEEIASILEDIIIIKEGELLRQCNCEELLALGYSVSGNAELVDAYIQGKEVLGYDMLGNYKSAYVLGECHRDTLCKDLQINPLDLQKLFIHLTNDGKEASI